MLNRRALLLGSAAVIAPVPAAEAFITTMRGGGPPPATGATTITIDEFPIGYFGTFYSWSNLTITGTTATDASSGNKFQTDCAKRPLTINGVAYLISSRTNGNTVVLASAPGNGTGISATLAYPGMVINRAAGTNARTITFTGTYTGNAPSGVDIQFTYAAACVVATPGAVFQAWAPLTSLSAGGGVWSGSVSVGLCSDWVVGQVRDHYIQAVTSSLQVNFWGVGVNFWYSGQSNTLRLFQQGPRTVSEDSRTRAFDHAGWHKIYYPFSPGIPAFSGGQGCDNSIRMMNEIANKMNCVCGMLDLTYSGTAIKAWLLFANGGYADNDTRNIWTTAGISAGGFCGGNGGGTNSSDQAGLNSSTLLIGKDFEAAIFQQGEQDLGSATYGTQLTALFNQLLSVNGRTASQFTFADVPIATIVPTAAIPNPPTTNSDANLVRNAQFTFISSTSPGAIYGGGVQDVTHNPFDAVTTGDYIHWCNSDYVFVGKRYTQAILKAIGAQAYGADGPRITSGSMSTGTNSLVLTITQDQGTALLNAAGAAGSLSTAAFTVTINGTPDTVTAASITGASQITLTTTSNRGMGQAVTVAYANGVNPFAIRYGQWANLSCTAASTTVTDAATLGIFTADMVGTNLVVSAGTNFVAGSYLITGYTNANTIAVATSPAPSGNGTAGAATVSVNATPNAVYDNFPWTGTLYPDTRGLPLQATNGAISIP